MDFSKLFPDWLKLKPVHFLSIAIASGVLLFGSNWGLQRLGLISVLDRFRPWVGVAFLCSVSGLAAHGLVRGSALVKASTNGFFYRRRLGKKLKNLSPREKQILAAMTFGESRTMNFGLTDGVIGGLVAQRLVYQSSNMGHVFTGMPYNIQPAVAEYIREHRDVLD